MDRAEIRAIRGALSRAAFARLLGVGPLTVLRWELSEGSKEARRPRPKMIEALRRLAGEGVGSAAGVGAEQHALDEDEDQDASEPVPLLAPTQRDECELDDNPEQQDELLVRPLLDALGGYEWARAEDTLLTLLSSTRLTTRVGRTLVSLGLVQAQLFGRLDLRAALITLHPLLDDAQHERLPKHVSARTHALAAFLFSGPDSRFFDGGRVNAHAARAEQLLGEGEGDLLALVGASRIFAARFLDPLASRRVFEANDVLLERASAPFFVYCVGRARSASAAMIGDLDSARRYAAGVAASGERLGAYALITWGAAEFVWRVTRGPDASEAVLAVARSTREMLGVGRLIPSESLLRIFAGEIEVLTRLGRFDEALQVAREALQLSAKSGLPDYALAMPITRLYTFCDRASELEGLAASFEGGASASFIGTPPVSYHALLVRASLASLNMDYARAAELAERVCRAPESAPGMKYLIHEAYFDLALAKLVAKDVAGAEQALQRADELLERNASLWHSGQFLWLRGLWLAHLGRFAEARQKIEASAATLRLAGDVTRSTIADSLLGLVETRPARERIGAPPLEGYRAYSPQLARRAAMFAALLPNSSAKQSLSERLVVAVERLSVPGLTAALVTSELTSIVAELFPGREVLFDRDTSPEKTVAFNVGGARLTAGVTGPMTPEELAIVRLLALLTPLVQTPSRAAIEAESPADGVLPYFIARSAASKQLKTQIAQLSRCSATILITGESGSGKEIVARAVHDSSGRSGRPYVIFNCASVPRELFESQLFGHRKGAFTGATNDNLGVIRAADGGTLFLDEIGELPLDMQPKLLRFLENGEVLPLGEPKARRVDARILAATHRDLWRLVREGQFREDLYYRLNVVPLQVAPLRERKEDVLALARLFVRRLAITDPPELGEDAVHALREHSWPGNVRELRNVIERAMAYAPLPSVLSAEHLRIEERSN